MRISDWSSDVCSSDLNVRPRMIAEQEVDATKHRIGADDLGKRLVQRVSGEAVIHHRSIPCPAAGGDGNAIRIGHSDLRRLRRPGTHRGFERGTVRWRPGSEGSREGKEWVSRVRWRG